MKLMHSVLLFLSFIIPLYSQTLLQGVVVREENGDEIPLIGALVRWKGTSIGTTTNEEGQFSIPRTRETNQLIVSYIGYRSDTVDAAMKHFIKVILTPTPQSIAEVTVEGERLPRYIDYSDPFNKNVITEKELFRAACCNLSESFTTNPSVDVTFTDAITGTKQIEMLGLSSVYTQITAENMPFIRGFLSNVGLTFIPGPWIDVINVSKGIGSVVNGYESITGQIDISFRQPNDENQKTIFLNLYGNHEQRYEANLNIRNEITEHLHSMTFLHGSTQRHAIDGNRDGFLDSPLFSTTNLLQLIGYRDETGFESHFGVHLLDETKHGGTYDRDPPTSYHFNAQHSLVRMFWKSGIVDQTHEGRSIGLQCSYTEYRSKNQFGVHPYEAREQSGGINLIYQDHVGSELHTYRTGISFLYGLYKERFDRVPFARLERIPGIFVEYTFTPNEDVTVVAGVRFDKHNAYGTMATPRIHLRLSPTPDWVFRFSGGRGFRTANIFAENTSALTSGRAIRIIPTNNIGYGMLQEAAWTFGFNLVHFFLVNSHEATVAVDVYRTMFDRVVLVDLDSDASEVRFYSVANGAVSTSIQCETTIRPFKHFLISTAYRYLNTRQAYAGVWKLRPFTAKHRVLGTLSYQFEQGEKVCTPSTIDLTIQWFGEKRLPPSASNVIGEENSPSFAVVNIQLTTSLTTHTELYSGVENLFDFKQSRVIINGDVPLHPTFDASRIWGPLMGRMVYLGIRYRL
ncbi:MAG: TonB-dependent receptor [Bacteroidetes bacterium]|nr:TonB-dependent receptor [Bacteroidota bacterium]